LNMRKEELLLPYFHFSGAGKT